MMTLKDIALRLHALGHAPEYPTLSEAFLRWVLSDLGEELLRRYQRYHGLAETGSRGDVAAHLLKPRCGHPDILPDSAESRWAIGSLQYWQEIAYPGVDPAEIAADYSEAIGRMTDVCGIAVTAAAAPAAAQIVARSGPIDGEWNVLALTELPPPGATTGVVLNQTFDVAEIGLSRDQRIAMMAHEAGHFLGLGHATPGSGNLMEPVLGTIGAPQAWDTQQLQQRYGLARAAAPAPAPVAPTPTPTPTATPGDATAGPAATSLIVNVPSAGDHRYQITFDTGGYYLVLIVPLHQ